MSDINKIPKHWEIKKLGEVCNVLDNLRKPINSSERQIRIAGKNQNTLFPYYGATGQVGWIDDFLTDGEYILIGEDGAPFLDIFKDKAYKIKGKTWVNNHAHILKGKEQFLMNDFALFYLNSINYRDFVNGTTRLKLTKSSLVEIPFVVPPLPEQQAIVAKIEELLSQLDSGKQQLQTAQQQLKVYRQSLLKWAFEGKLTNKKIKDGELPKGWRRTTLGDVISISSGNGLTRTKRDDEGKYLVYGGNGVTGKHSEYLFEDEKLIIGRVGVNCGNAHKTKPKSWVTDNAFIVSFDEKEVSRNFLLHLIKILNLNKYSVSTAQPVISQGKLYPIEVSIPPIEEQQLIEDELESKLTICDKIEETINQSLQQAETLRQSILKQAFEGKLINNN